MASRKTYRTKTIDLASKEGNFLAYKVKLSAGGYGLYMINLGKHTTASFTINKRDGLPVPYHKMEMDDFPADMVMEAINTLKGERFSLQPIVNAATHIKNAKPEEVCADELWDDFACMSERDEFDVIVKEYMDKKGKLDIKRLNKDLIQFSRRSKVVDKMISAIADGKWSTDALDEIMAFILKSRAADMLKKRDNMTEQEALRLVAALDAMAGRQALKDLKVDLRNRVRPGSRR